MRLQTGCRHDGSPEFLRTERCLGWPWTQDLNICDKPIASTHDGLQILGVCGVVFTMVLPVRESTPTGKYSLVFHRYGTRHFLSQIKTPDGAVNKVAEGKLEREMIERCPGGRDSARVSQVVFRKHGGPTLLGIPAGGWAFEFLENEISCKGAGLAAQAISLPQVREGCWDPTRRRPAPRVPVPRQKT